MSVIQFPPVRGAKRAEARRQAEMVRPTLFQEQILLAPEDYDAFIAGGRGGGKTTGCMLVGARYCEQYGAKARVLFVRQSYAGAEDFVTASRLFFGEAYGNRARFNGTDRIWRLPNGSTLAISQLEDLSDFRKFQGKGYGLIIVDECGQWPDLSLLELLRSCLRAPKGVPVRMVWAANPGGASHAELARRFVLGREPWVPFEESKSGRTWIYCPSTYVDNPHLDAESYRRQLEAATATDPELRKAWIFGDWSARKGSYFAASLEEQRCLVPDWKPNAFADWRRTVGYGWKVYGSADWGSSAPAVLYLLAKSDGMPAPDGRSYPPGSIVAFDELTSSDPDDLNRGLGWSTSTFAEAARDMFDVWKLRSPPVAIDDAVFSFHGSTAGTIGDELRRAGLSVSRAHKGRRVDGWQRMAQMFLNCGKPDRPGLYLTPRCTYAWQTLPFLPRDPRRNDDLLSTGPDHGADALRLGLNGASGGGGAVSSLPICGI